MLSKENIWLQKNKKIGWMQTGYGDELGLSITGQDTGWLYLTKTYVEGDLQVKDDIKLRGTIKLYDNNFLDDNIKGSIFNTEEAVYFQGNGVTILKSLEGYTMVQSVKGYTYAKDFGNTTRI